MANFTTHTIESAPEGSKAILENLQKQLGFIPNILAILADSPATLDTYLHGIKQLHNNSAFSPREFNALYLAISSDNKCGYCTKAHVPGAIKGGLTTQEIADILDSKPLADQKLNTLVDFGHKIVVNRGFVEQQDIDTLLNAGFTNQHVIEVILIASLKTITNYTNHVAHTELDEQFK